MSAHFTHAPRASRRRSATHLSGQRLNAAGHMIWGAETDSRGQTHVSVTADTPTGDLVVATLTYPSYEAASQRLPTALEHFERSTLAGWDHPAGTRQSITRIRGWYLAYGREPGHLPVLRRTRITGPTAASRGWNRYSIRSAPHANNAEELRPRPRP